MLFKKKYIISIYNKADELIYVCESSRDLIDYLKQPVISVRTILWRAVKSPEKMTYIDINEKRCCLYLIDMTEEQA